LGQPRRILRTIVALLLSAAISLVLGVWATRPIRVYSEWLGLVGQQDDAPTVRLQRWAVGEIAPQTLSGLVSLFSWEEVVVGGTLVLALLALLILLATTWFDRWKGSLWATRLRAIRPPRVRFRVVTALALVAIVALGLAWEINSWKYWRLRRTYLLRAGGYSVQEEGSLAQEQIYARQMIELDRPLLSLEVHPRLTPQAEAAERAYTIDLYRKSRVRMAAQAVLARSMKVKYRHAADHPLEPVAPDPTPPVPEPDANTWIYRRDYGRALAAYDEQLRLYPDHAQTHGLRAWLLAACPDARHRDGPAAILSAKRACELTRWAAVDMLAILAAAYAEAGDFEAAVRWQETVLDRPVNPVFKTELETRLRLYQSRSPVRWQR
jgi:tetratricopeptide (TPR) repeat protein